MRAQGDSRQVEESHEATLLSLGDLIIDLPAREVTLSGERILLTRREFDLLAYLARHPGWVATPGQLLEDVWGYRFVDDTRLIGVHVGNLRKKLGESAESPRFIYTVRGAGYKLVVPTAPTASADGPAGDRGGDPSSAPERLLGREREMLVLRQALELALRGQGGSVLVWGDAGIGKTRLAEEISREAALRGALPLWGRCLESGGLPAYWPWTRIFQQLLDLPGQEGLLDHLDMWRRELAILMPAMQAQVKAPSLAASSESAGRGQILQAITSALIQAAGRRPLVVVLDDVHWADTGSLLALQVLVGEIRQVPLMVLATSRGSRSDWSVVVGSTVTTMARGRFQELPLTGVDAEALAGIAADATGAKPSAAALETIARRSEGNPFFALEFTRLLSARGLLQADVVGDTEEMRLSRGAESLLTQRMTSLSGDCRRVLEVGALLGRHFEPLTLIDSSGLPAQRVLELLDQALEADLIVRGTNGSGFAFRHPLLRDVLLSGLSVRERLALHADVARALERRASADPEDFLFDLAEHYSLAAPLGLGGAALHYCRLAGDASLRRFAYEDAAGFFARALTMLPYCGSPDESRPALAAALHERLTDAWGQTENRNETVEACDKGLLLLPGEECVWRARLHRKAGSALLAMEQPDRSLARLAQAEDALNAEPGALADAWWQEWIEIQLQRAATFYFSGDLPALAAVLEQAREPVQERGTEEQRVAVGVAGLSLAFRRERYLLSTDTVAHAHAHRRSQEARGSEPALLEADFLLGFTLLWAGETSRACRHLNRCADAAARLRDRRRLVQALCYLAVARRLQLDGESTTQAVQQALEAAQTAGFPGYVAAAKGNLSWLATREGNSDRAERLARDALRLWNAPSAFPFEWLARGPLLALLVEKDDLSGALEQVEGLLEPRQQRLSEELERLLKAALAAGHARSKAASRASLLDVLDCVPPSWR